MSKGLTIGGIVILVIGVFALVYGTYIHGIQSRNIQQCQSFTGKLGQFFDSETSDLCQRASSIVMISLTAMIAGIVMIVIGGILSAVGVIRKPTPRGTTIPVKVPLILQIIKKRRTNYMELIMRVNHLVETVSLWRMNYQNL